MLIKILPVMGSKLKYVNVDEIVEYDLDLDGRMIITLKNGIKYVVYQKISEEDFEYLCGFIDHVNSETYGIIDCLDVISEYKANQIIEKL